MNKAKEKGKRGEREVVGILQEIVNAEHLRWGIPPVEISRNLNQFQREGRFDIFGVPWAAIEVKFCETKTLGSWWRQCLEACEDNQEPILFYRSSHEPWRVRMLGELRGEEISHCGPVDIDLEFFKRYFQGRVYEELKKTILNSGR